MDDDLTQVGEGGGERGSVLQAGEVFEEYKIIRLLGRGGMGEVYEVEHRDLGTRHALKLIHPDIVGRAGSGERFRREAKVMAQLRHENIVHVDDFRQSGDRAWLRMELVGGSKTYDEKWKTRGSGGELGSGSLDDLLKSKGRLPEPQVREILKQVLQGLAFAHEQGVVHRDLKPANILLDEGQGMQDPSPEDLLVKIADFGLVRLAGEQWLQSQVQLSVTRSMTMGSAPTEVEGESGSGGTSTKALLGTFAYMSPEQKRGEEADARSDLYSVGLMAYQMLTGEEQMGIELPGELIPELNPAWDEWIRKAVASHKQRRYQRAEEMLWISDAIEEAAIGEQTVTEDSPLEERIEVETPEAKADRAIPPEEGSLLGGTLRLQAVVFLLSPFFIWHYLIDFYMSDLAEVSPGFLWVDIPVFLSVVSFYGLFWLKLKGAPGLVYLTRVWCTLFIVTRMVSGTVMNDGKIPHESLTLFLYHGNILELGHGEWFVRLSSVFDTLSFFGVLVLLVVSFIDRNPVRTEGKFLDHLKAWRKGIAFVVIGYLGLTPIFVMAYENYRIHEVKRTVTNNLRQIRNASKQYLLEYGKINVSNLDVIVGDFITEIKPVGDEKYAELFPISANTSDLEIFVPAINETVRYDF